MIRTLNPNHDYNRLYSWYHRSLTVLEQCETDEQIKSCRKWINGGIKIIELEEGYLVHGKWYNLILSALFKTKQKHIKFLNTFNLLINSIDEKIDERTEQIEDKNIFKTKIGFKQQS